MDKSIVLPVAISYALFGVCIDDNVISFDLRCTVAGSVSVQSFVGKRQTSVGPSLSLCRLLVARSQCRLQCTIVIQSAAAAFAFAFVVVVVLVEKVCGQLICLSLHWATFH